MPGHVVSAAEDNLVTHFPGGNCPVKGECRFGTAACQIHVEARPARARTRRIVIGDSVVGGTLGAEELQRTAERDRQGLVSKVCVGITTVIIQRPVLVKAIVDAAVGTATGQIFWLTLNIRLYHRV